MKAKLPIASFAKAAAFSFFSYFFEIRGTKAELKAPSAKNLLNIFGNLNAAKKASNMGPAPIKENNNISRTIPRIRLTKVQKPTVKKPDIKRIGLKIVLVPLQELLPVASSAQVFFVCFHYKILNQTCL